MANHAYVHTRKSMSSEKITDLLNELNRSRFKNVLLIEENEDTWRIASKDCDYDSRTFWLNTKRSFEIRHGGGREFIWWVDFIITNEIALKFDGTITDDGDGEKRKGKENYYPEFIDYVKARFSHVKDEKFRLALMQEEMEFTPLEHRVDLGPKIEIQFVENNK